MSGPGMTSLERAMTTMGGREPDRVPLFLVVTMHGATELGLSIPEYFASPANIVEGQLRLLAKYGHDCVVGGPYAAVEAVAWGGEVVFRDDGPPNTGEPPVRRLEDIASLEPPAVAGNPALSGALEVIAALAERCPDVPVVGGVVSPFSLPVLQLGFDTYLGLLRDRGDLFDRLMAVNEEFCVAWANAQLAAGATAVGLADPVASTTIVAPQTYRDAGREVVRRTISRIDGAVAVNFASGRCAGVLEDVIATGAAAAQVSADEDLRDLRRIAGDRLTLIGNLNGVAMRRWTVQEAETEVRRAIAAGAPGGRFVLSDNHGEIPFQVPEDVLHAIVDATHRWGTYPIAADAG